MNTKETGYIAIGVDIQNDFCPGGSLAVPLGDEIVEPFNTTAAAVRKLGGLVIFTRDWHPATTTHFDAWPPHCIASTYGAAFHTNLDVKANDIIISKGTKVDEDAYSGFQGTTPDGTTIEELIQSELLWAQKITLLIGGLATDYCVKATVLDALKLKEKLGDNSLDVIALPHAMRAVNISPTDGDAALLAMNQAGARFMSPEESLQ